MTPPGPPGTPRDPPGPRPGRARGGRKFPRAGPRAGRARGAPGTPRDPLLTPYWDPIGIPPNRPPGTPIGFPGPPGKTPLSTPGVTPPEPRGIGPLQSGVGDPGEPNAGQCNGLRWYATGTVGTECNPLIHSSHHHRCHPIRIASIQCDHHRRYATACNNIQLASGVDPSCITLRVGGADRWGFGLPGRT